ncbi:hypothetical protein [Amycolatopsis alba]|uniref:Transporter n=1 Tax=Amycolatopsis alba DSM 44262 TaxID=1125972 RepID=A0A229S2Z7_AMYAL|nr:hypothetical protein [Amycolatopsis alba]OXM53278.1 transporter [Amycolatopsis alba DSM 44262]
MNFRRPWRVALMISAVVSLVAPMVSVAQAATLATPWEILRESPPGENLPAGVDLRTVPEKGTAEQSLTDKNTPEPVTFDGCYVSRPPADGYFKNRFSTCQITQLHYQRYACPASACPLIGEAVVYVVVTRNMVPSQRRVVIGHRIQFAVLRGLPDTTRFGAAMTCAAKNTGGTAVCDVPEAKVTKSIAEWKARPVENTVFTMRGQDAPDPADPPGIRAEKRAWYNLGRTLFVEGENGKVLDAPTLSTQARCDVADYVQGSKCVFPRPAMFYVDLHDPETAEYGRLVADALHGSVSSVYPGRLEGHYIPGNFSNSNGKRNHPITRIHHDQAAWQANKLIAERYCQQRWGPKWHRDANGWPRECAVYPFNSTKDGAALSPGTSEGSSFAVNPVLEGDYLAMERSVNDFLSRHHILDGDTYWVWILY